MFEKCYDCVIVGQGIAGSLVAMRGLELGLKILVIDDKNEANASSIAAGLVEAISGKRWTLSYRANEWMPFAKDIYEKLERRLGVTFINHLENYRVILDGKQEQFVQKRLKDPVINAYLGDFISKLPFGLFCQKGAYKIKESFSIKASILLNAVRKELALRQVLRKEILPMDHIKWHQQRLFVKLKEASVQTRSLIFCQGHQLENNPFFQDLDFRPSRGDVLTLASPQLKPNCHIVQKEWLVPVCDQHYRFGATYDWPPYDAEALRLKNREKLSVAIKNWGIDDVSILQHQHGFRCNLSTPQPILRAHHKHPEIFVLGALGSKGFMSAPYLSHQFFEKHLIPMLGAL